jgi:hypothetical protein
MRSALRGWPRCYDLVVNADEIRTFAWRDWAAVAETKARYWAERKRAMTPEEALGQSDLRPILDRELALRRDQPG